MDVTVSEALAAARSGTGPLRCAVWSATRRGDGRFTELLPAEERERAERLVNPDDRDRFVTGRALLRLVIGRQLGLSAAGLRIDIACHRCGGPHGKPRLADGASTLSFNLSHAGERVVVAVAGGAAVGVDVQAYRDVDATRAAALAVDLLTAIERDELRERPPDVRARALTGWWTRKEAVLKATGEGLAIPPVQLSVTGPPTPPALIAWGRDLRWSDGVAPRVRMHDLSDPGFAVSVALLTARQSAISQHDGDVLLTRWRNGT